MKTFILSEFKYQADHLKALFKNYGMMDELNDLEYISNTNIRKILGYRNGNLILYGLWTNRKDSTEILNFARERKFNIINGDSLIRDFIKEKQKQKQDKRKLEFFKKEEFLI